MNSSPAKRRRLIQTKVTSLFQETSNGTIQVRRGHQKLYDASGRSSHAISFEERPATANSVLTVCNPQTFPAIHKILTILLTTPVGSVSCEVPQVVEPVYNERGTFKWLRDAPYSSWDGLHTGNWGDLPNATKLGEVNDPDFVLTE